MSVWDPVAKYTYLFIKRLHNMHNLEDLENILSDVVKFPFARRLNDSV